MVTESVPSWIHQDSDEALVHVNVGGLRRSLCSSTLKKFPDTRLGKLLACDSEEDILQVGLQVWIHLHDAPPVLILPVLQVCDDYDVQQKEFYFDRNPGLFRYVLHFYQTGKLHIMEGQCVFSFRSDVSIHHLIFTCSSNQTHSCLCCPSLMVKVVQMVLM